MSIAPLQRATSIECSAKLKKKMSCVCSCTHGTAKQALSARNTSSNSLLSSRITRSKRRSYRTKSSSTISSSLFNQAQLIRRILRLKFARKKTQLGQTRSRELVAFHIQSEVASWRPLELQEQERALHSHRAWAWQRAISIRSFSDECKKVYR